MKKYILHYLAVTIVFLGLSACAPKADYDIRGTWDYTMISLDGNQYDIGTITFDGSDSKGNYTQINIYNVEYVGDYQVSCSDITLTGYENWKGAFISENTMSGSWHHDDGTQGTFEASRK
jgi:hypothetical protein